MKLCSFFFLIYFLSTARLDNFYLSIYRFTDSFLVLLHCVVKPIHLVFCWCYSVTKSHLTLCDSTDCSMPGLPVPHRLLEFAQVHVHCISDAIQPSSFSVTLFSFCLQSFPASGSFQMSQLFTSGGQSIGVSASASVLPMSIQSCFPLRLTGLSIRLMSHT